MLPALRLKNLKLILFFYSAFSVKNFDRCFCYYNCNQYL